MPAVLVFLVLIVSAPGEAPRVLRVPVDSVKACGEAIGPMLEQAQVGLDGASFAVACEVYRKPPVGS